MADLTVIIAAFKAQNFIEECLDSVQAQIVKPSRVVVGVDGCKQTMDKLNKIKAKYDNLEVIYYPTNRGTYITFNSLLSHVKDYVITFGADDVMHPDLTAVMLHNAPCISTHSGVMCIRMASLRKVGGFRDWRIAADTDINKRLRRSGTRLQVVSQLYEYRQHKGQSTKGKSGYGSEERNRLYDFIRSSEDVYVEPITHD